MDWKKKMSKLLKKYNYINDLYLKKKKNLILYNSGMINPNSQTCIYTIKQEIDICYECTILYKQGTHVRYTNISKCLTH